MNHEQARLLLMDYLYDEISKEDKMALEAYMSQHPELRDELQEMQETAGILDFMPVDQPTEKIVIVPSSLDTVQKPANVWYMNNFVRSFAGVAAALIIFFMGASITKTQISFDENGFNLAFGADSQPTQAGFTPEQVQAIVLQVQQDNAEQMNQLIQLLQTDQENQLQRSLNDFAAYWDNQRQQDLELISLGFDRLEESTYNKFRQTDEVLGEIIQTVGTDR